MTRVRDRRGAALTLELPPTELEALRVAAEAAGLTIQLYVRRALLAAHGEGERVRGRWPGAD